MTCLSFIRSLNLRANVTQETLFQELQHLKALVQESLKAAQRPEAMPDPFSARQSKNLENLARAAQKFHHTASSTASTRYGAGEHRSLPSNWGGSEVGGLTEVERERIEKWNALSTVEESTDGSIVDGTLLSTPGDTSTTLTTPDMEDVPAEPAKITRPVGEEGLDDDDDDESDVELDFLRNFEELAYANFMSQNYVKAEQCLRSAVERSTGDASGGTDFKQLKMQLALCCCLQEKWDHAQGILSKLPKTRVSANLAIFHLWQAISLAHLAAGRFDDAYNTCKTVLQGKKKILGRSSPDYNECLYVFATICESRGDPLEAEAVRHSIPRGWAPKSHESITSPTHFLLQHPSLAGLVFQKKYTDGNEGYSAAEEIPMSPQSCDSPETGGGAQRASGHWTMLVPGVARDGVQRAEHDERKGMLVEDTDTGKEFLAHTVPKIVFNQTSEPVPSVVAAASAEPAQPISRTQSPVTSPGVSASLSQDSFAYQERRQGVVLSSAIPKPSLPTRPPPIPPKIHKTSRSADLTGHGVGRSDSFRSLGLSITRSRSHNWRTSQSTTGTDDSNGLSRSHSHSRSLHPRYEAGADLGLHREHLSTDLPSPDTEPLSPESLSPSDVGPHFTGFRPRAYQTLIDKVRAAEARSMIVQGSQTSTLPWDDDAQPSSEGFIEHVPGTAGPGTYSTMQVVGTCNVYNEPQDVALSAIPAVTASYQRKISRSVNTSGSTWLEIVRRRWTIQKDLGNIGGLRPFSRFGPAQFLGLRRQTSASSLFHVGVSVRMEASDSIALSTGQGEVTICDMAVSHFSSIILHAR